MRKWAEFILEFAWLGVVLGMMVVGFVMYFRRALLVIAGVVVVGAAVVWIVGTIRRS